MDRNYLILILLISTFYALTPKIVHAQANAVQNGMTENPCLDTEQSRPPPEFLKAMMQPGEKMPPMLQPGDEAFQAMMKSRAESQARDFGNLCHYKSDNARFEQSEKSKVVFIGDSITEGWSVGDPSLFETGFVNRGIGGQTSPQILLRFYQDVIALRPDVVHIMAGTNDLAGNTGPNSPEDYKNNIRVMVDLAAVNNIQVVLASILPITNFPWQSDSNFTLHVPLLNKWLKQFAAERKIVYADYYTATATSEGKFKSNLSNDGVHPHIKGYSVMRPIIDAALKAALKD